MYESALQFVPTFVLAMFRLGGMMLAAPLFGSARIPVRIKVMLALVLTVGFMPAIPAPAPLPASAWELSVGIGGELAFGLAIGTSLSFVFVAVTWAGELIGQQMGLGMGAVLDPQFGASGSVVGDMYFMLTTVIFLCIRGHHALLRGVRASFESLPLLSLGMTQDLLSIVVGLMQAATALAVQLAAPMLVTMLLVDVVMGFVGKTIPQINVMTAGLSLRSLLGIGLLIACVAMTSEVIREALYDYMERLAGVWAGMAA